MSRESDELRHLIEAGFSHLNSRLDKVDARLDKMDARFDKVDARLDKMDDRFDKMDARFDQVVAEQRRHGEAVAEIRGELRGLAAWLSAMDSRFMAIMRPYEPPQRPSAAE